ncbi:glycoside hydrolase [Clavulina sp. PMI_390]|nr:glycoside hydrolase [Clavulina sp. PMI_390]
MRFSPALLVLLVPSVVAIPAATTTSANGLSSIISSVKSSESSSLSVLSTSSVASSTSAAPSQSSSSVSQSSVANSSLAAHSSTVASELSSISTSLAALTSSLANATQSLLSTTTTTSKSGAMANAQSKSYLARFTPKTGLVETLEGFGRDLLVSSEEFETFELPQLLAEFAHGLNELLLNKGQSHPSPSSVLEPLLGGRELGRSSGTKSPAALNGSISKMLAANKARSSWSNTREFLRHPKRQKLNDAPASESSSMDIDNMSKYSSARTSTVKINRDIQMRHDIVKNPEGPLGRTMLAMATEEDPPAGPGQGTGGIISPMLANALASPPTPTMQRHPGLQERFDNIEEHLRITWVPAPPEDVRLRLQSIEEHIMKLERKYPPWASLHFNQPNSITTEQAQSIAHKIIIPSHLTISDDQSHLKISRPASLDPLTDSKPPTKGRKSTLLRAVMDKAEVARALGEGSRSSWVSWPAPPRGITSSISDQYMNAKTPLQHLRSLLPQTSIIMSWLHDLKNKVEHKIQENVQEVLHQNEGHSQAAADQPQQSQAQPDSQNQVWRLSEHDVYRYRKQYGLNLGSWFTLERWIAESVFEGVSGSSELDVVEKAGNAKERLERHWDEWMREEDWVWIKERGFNTVRIPIGYYHCSGLDRGLLDGTQYARYADTYSDAWRRIVDAIDTARNHSIGVLIDLHAAPGAQNKWDHSGTPSGQVHFWEGSNPEATSRVLQALAVALNDKKNVVGLNLMNEPDNSNSLQGWYESTITSVRGAISERAGDGPPASQFPIYISDAWDGNWYSKIVGKREDFVVLDHHYYRCFTPQDKKQSGEQLAEDTKRNKKEELRRWHIAAHGNFIIGEWSAGLDPQGMPHGANAGEQDRQRRVFVKAQREVYDEMCAGQFFWTYKKGQGWDAGWSARNAAQAAILPEWVAGPRGEFNDANDDEREDLLRQASERHLNYWAQHNCSYHEMWRFEEGWRQGWEDSGLYVRCGKSELGYKHRWMMHRTKEHEAAKGGSKNLWEYSHGFEQGFDNGWARRIPERDDCRLMSPGESFAPGPQ